MIRAMAPVGTRSGEDALAAIAADLLSAVLEPAFWPPALSLIAGEIGCGRILLVRAEGARRVILATSDLDPGAVRRLAGRRLGEDEVRLVEPPEARREVELPEGSGLRLMLDREQIAPAAERLLERAGPLVARAWRLTDAFAASQRHQAWTANLLEKLATGVLVLDRSGRVLQGNDAARRLLAEQSEVSIARGVLRAETPAVERTLSELLARALRFQGRGAATETLYLPRQDEKPALELLIVASPRFADGNPEAVAVGLVFDPRRREQNPAAVLAHRFHLGYEESQVVSLLLHGHDIPTISGTLDVPDAAVQACLASLYDRIGTTRQVELVKLLLMRGGGVV
jgi:PAS domain-containing protein